MTIVSDSLDEGGMPLDCKSMKKRRGLTGEKGVVSVYENCNKGGVASIPVSPGEGGVVTVSVSPLGGVEL